MFPTRGPTEQRERLKGGCRSLRHSSDLCVAPEHAKMKSPSVPARTVSPEYVMQSRGRWHARISLETLPVAFETFRAPRELSPLVLAAGSRQNPGDIPDVGGKDDDDRRLGLSVRVRKCCNMRDAEVNYINTRIYNDLPQPCMCIGAKARESFPRFRLFFFSRSCSLPFSDCTRPGALYVRKLRTNHAAQR